MQLLITSESDNVRDDKQPEGEVEFIGNTVANRNSGFVGDAVHTI